MAETPEERKKRLMANLEKARIAKKEKAELRKKAQAEGDQEALDMLTPSKKPKARNLAKVVREILNDDEIVDQVVQNQPEYWSKIPHKNPAYIITTVMAVKAMGGDIKAAEYLRKTGYGDKVTVESEEGFFSKTDFRIHVVPSKELESGINSQEVLEGEIQQIEE